MLSQNQMVRKAIESTYIGKCTVIEHKKTVNANHTTSFNDEIVYKVWLEIKLLIFILSLYFFSLFFIKK